MFRLIKCRNFSTTARLKDDCLGFIGLGNMGGHMVNNLLKNKHNVYVYDKSSEALAASTESGATGLSTPAEIALKCKIIITMLPSSPHVKEVYTGKDGLFSTASTGSLFIDSSTIDPDVSRSMESLGAKINCTFVDAPVSGGVTGAKDGTLTFMVGGAESSFDKVKSILENMGKNIVYCGASGNGQVAKICNNMLLAISMIGTAEAMNLGIRLGIDAMLLASIINSSSGQCWSSLKYNPCPGILENIPSSNNYVGGFGSALMAKDLGLAQNSSTNTLTPTPMGSLAHQIYRTMCQNGYATKDFASVFEFLKNK